MTGGERIRYTQLVAQAFYRRREAARLLEEAEEYLVKARELAGDEWMKEEMK